MVGDDSGLSDLTRVLQRILDGQRPAQGSTRNRPLQQFVGAVDTVLLKEDASTGPTEVFHSLFYPYGAAATVYGKCIYSPSYGDLILADAPAGWWRLNEASGSSAADSSGNSNTGTYTGGVTLGQAGALTGDSDTAALFDGSTGYVRIGTAKILGGLASYSIEAWFKTSTSGITQTLYSERSTGALDILNFRLDTLNSQFVLQLRDDAGTINSLTSNARTMSDGAWHHAVVVNSANAVTFYLDGAPFGTATKTISNNFTNGDIKTNIGAEEVNGLYFNGTLDEVAIYPTALSAAQVTAHYNRGKQLS